MRSQFRFLVSAYGTAQAMIRFADAKAETLFVIYGVLVALITTRVEPAVQRLRSPKGFSPLALVTFLLFCAFIGLMFYALSQAVSTVRPRFRSPASAEAGARRRLYWCHDVLARECEAYLAAVRGLSDEAALEEMAQELFDAQAIEAAKFARIGRAYRMSAVSLAVWCLTLVLSLAV
jgi:pycsar effector protein